MTSDRTQAVGAVGVASTLQKLGANPVWQSFGGYLFIAPAAIFLGAVIVYPLLTTIVGSFLEFAPRQGPARYVGLEHYRRLVGDGIFWLSMWNTLLYTIGSVIFHALVGGFLALLLNEPFAPSRVRNVARGLFILPWLFSLAASALIWALLYQPAGPINYLLQAIGIIVSPIDFLGDPDFALWSLVAVNVWKYFPFYMVIILGNLQSIPFELYEAARMDGAGRVQRFWFVTLPMLRRSLIAITTIDFITTFGVFDIVKLMTNGGPFRRTQTAAYYIWQVGLRDVNFGYGSAISVVMLAVVASVSAVYLKLALGKNDAAGTNL